MQGGAFSSGSKSLNYNNGVSYAMGSTNKGVAISPKINIGALSFPVLAFKCNYETETTGTQHDKRFVKVGFLGSNGQPTYHYEGQVATTGGTGSAGTCAAMGTWHEHVVILNPSWGNIRVAFAFDTVDAYSNNFKGWFVDDFKIVEATSLIPGVPPEEEPPGGGIPPPSEGGETPGDNPPGGGTPGGGTPGGGTSGGGTSGGGNSSGGGTSAGGSSTTVYSSNFDDTAATTGWTLGGTEVAWAADATPASFPGGAYKSGPSSLNYNDGTDYDNGQTNSGAAQSLVINLTNYAETVLKFQCNYQTETAGPQFDKRIVKVYSGSGTTPVLSAQVASTGGSAAAGPCAAMGTWHEHTIVLDPGWGGITIEFLFDTVDNYDNNKAGWAIDDLSVTGTPTTTGGGGTSGGGTGGGSETPPPANDPGVAGSSEAASSDGGSSGGGCFGTTAGLSISAPWIFLVIASLFLGLRRRTPL